MNVVVDCTLHQSLNARAKPSTTDCRSALEITLSALTSVTVSRVGRAATHRRA